MVELLCERPPGGKTLALAMLMRGTGRVYAMDISARRLAARSAARLGPESPTYIPMVLSGDNDPRANAWRESSTACSSTRPAAEFGTLRRNPDLKWRHSAQAIVEPCKQLGILRAASRLVKPGGRLLYATCSILHAENEAIAQGFASASEFVALSCDELLAAQRIALQTEARASPAAAPARHRRIFLPRLSSAAPERGTVHAPEVSADCFLFGLAQQKLRRRATGLRVEWLGPRKTTPRKLYNFMIFSGFFDLPWWGYVLVALGLTHVTIAAVTIYLHRC